MPTTASVSYKPLTYTLIAVIIGLTLVFIMSGAAPFLYVFLLALIIPATAYLYLRAKRFVFISPFLLAVMLIWNYNIVFLLCAPLFLLGFCACVAAAKSGKLFFGAAVIIAAVLLGLALPVFAATTIKDRSAGDIAAEYILTRQDDNAVMNMAKNYLFETEIAELYSDSKDLYSIKRDAALTVNGMSDEEILERYSRYVKNIVNHEILYFVFSTGVLLAMIIFLTLTLLVLNYQYLLKKCVPPVYLNKKIYRMTPPRHIVMPRRFALFALVPYIIIFLLRYADPIFGKLFDATYYGIILVPFGFAGIGLAYYLLNRLRINNGYATLIIIPIVYFAFLIFSIVGIVDYFLNLRFIIEHYGKGRVDRR